MDRRDATQPTSGTAFGRGTAAVAGRLGAVIRRVSAALSPAIGAEPVLSVGGGGGYRSASRPESGRQGGFGPTGGSPRGPRTGGGGAPQPERYWTDYLRIALPVIGLIVMLAVFIFWVQAIIGNDSNSSPTPTFVALTTSNPPSAAPSTSPTSIATEPSTSLSPSSSAASSGNASGQAAAQTTSTTAPNDQVTPTTAPSDQGAASDTSNTSANAGSSDTASPSDNASPSNTGSSNSNGSGQYSVGDTVTVTDDGVRLRDSASENGQEKMTLNQGDTLTIVSGPEQGGNYEWYEVTTGDGTDGWVASDFIQAAAG